MGLFIFLDILKIKKESFNAIKKEFISYSFVVKHCF